MLEFLGNLWGWVIENKDAIVTTVTSANFISIVGAVVVLVRTNRQNKKNMSMGETLTNTLNTNNAFIGTVDEIRCDGKNNSENIKSLTETVNMTLEKVNNFEERICTKVDAMMEALQIAWSTIKDDNIRTTVAGILTNARYKETNKIEEMKQQLEDLKKQLLEQNELMKQQVVDTVDEVRVVMDAKTMDTTVSRG